MQTTKHDKIMHSRYATQGCCDASTDSMILQKCAQAKCRTPAWHFGRTRIVISKKLGEVLAGL
jgi:hypothetical protein